MSSFHISIPLSSAIRMLDGTHQERRQIMQVLGYSSVKALRKDLNEMVESGMESIPSDVCDNNEKGKCKGHEL